MDSEIVFRFVDDGVSTSVKLLWDRAPETCRAIRDLLPLNGYAHHAIYSGSEVAFILPQLLVLPPEKPTSTVAPGDVGFVWFRGGSSYGVEEDFSEICWFYDRDATPSMAEGPVPVTIFAQLSDEQFFAMCRRMRREGIKRIEIVSVDASESS